MILKVVWPVSKREHGNLKPRVLAQGRGGDAARNLNCKKGQYPATQSLESHQLKDMFASPLLKAKCS